MPAANKTTPANRTQAEIMAAKRQAIRDQAIDLTPRNPDRRLEAEADDFLWLNTYLPDVFYNPFTNSQRDIVNECAATLQYGTKKCKAAPRGDGKSSIVKYLSLKYALTRKVRFPLVLAATCPKATKILASLKAKLRSPVNKVLHEDYPLGS